MAWPQTQRSARPSAVPDPARPFGSSTDPHSCHAHGRPVQLPPSSSAFLGEGFVRKSKEGQDEEHAVVGFLGGRGLGGGGARAHVVRTLRGARRVVRAHPGRPALPPRSRSRHRCGGPDVHDQHGKRLGENKFFRLMALPFLSE